MFNDGGFQPMYVCSTCLTQRTLPLHAHHRQLPSFCLKSGIGSLHLLFHPLFPAVRAGHPLHILTHDSTPSIRHTSGIELATERHHHHRGQEQLHRHSKVVVGGKWDGTHASWLQGSGETTR